jgi:hypothetical protein
MRRSTSANAGSPGAAIFRAALSACLPALIACSVDWKAGDAHDAGATSEPSSAKDAAPDAMDPWASTDHEPSPDGGDEPPACKSHEMLCDGVCTNVDNEPKHCGTCDNACSDSEVCLEGKCSTSCGDLTKCPGNVCAELTSDVDHCGSCDMACPSPPKNGHASCDGNCQIECDDTYRACGVGCYKLDDPDHCGAACAKCTAPPNATATCNGTTCGSQCLVSTLSCVGGDSACGSFNFESGSPEGFALVSSVGGSPNSFAASTAKAVEGSYSLAAGFATTLGLAVNLCPGTKATDLRNKKLSGRMFVDGPTLPLSDDNYLSVFVTTPAGQVAVSEQQKLQTGAWFAFSADFDPGVVTGLDKVTTLSFSLRLYDTRMTGYSATMYLDDVRIE